MRYAKCIACYSAIGWIGLIANAFLMILEAFVGLVSGSQALVADAMYSAKDVITALLVIVGLKVSTRPLDREHPYGHGKIEFILSLVVSVCFIAVTGFLFVHALQTLWDESVDKAPHLIALWTAFLSIGVNVAMYFYSRCVSIETNSPILLTLAKHHHADASSSTAVAAGIIGAHYLDMPWIDTLVAVFETMHLMYLGADVFRDAYRGLMDRSTSKPVRERIARVAESVEGVREMVALRTRHVGQEIWGDITIAVGSGLSVEEAYDIGLQLQAELGDRIPYLGAMQVRFETDEERSGAKSG